MTLTHHDNDNDHLITNRNQRKEDGLLQSKCGHWLLLPLLASRLDRLPVNWPRGKEHYYRSAFTESHGH